MLGILVKTFDRLPNAHETIEIQPYWDLGKALVHIQRTLHLYVETQGPKPIRESGAYYYYILLSLSSPMVLPYVVD